MLLRGRGASFHCYWRYDWGCKSWSWFAHHRLIIKWPTCWIPHLYKNDPPYGSAIFPDILVGRKLTTDWVPKEWNDMAKCANFDAALKISRVILYPSMAYFNIFNLQRSVQQRPLQLRGRVEIQYLSALVHFDSTHWPIPHVCNPYLCICLWNNYGPECFSVFFVGMNLPTQLCGDYFMR